MAAQIPGPTVLFVDQSGYVNREWYRYLSDTFTEHGGPSGILPVAAGGTGLSFGVNGAVLYFSATATIASSLELANNQIVFGGGAGAPPKTAGLASTKVNQVLLSGTTSGALPSWSVAAYPAYALNPGQIMRAKGNNWAATVATFPETSAQGDILLSSVDNAWTSLAKDANATRYLSNRGLTNNAQWSLVNLTDGVEGELPENNIIQVQVFGA